MSQPIARTLVEAYLRNRGITALHEAGSLRFHPRCYYRPDEHFADRDLAGDDRPRHRSRRPHHRRASHLARSDGFDRIRLGKAPIDTPRRAMGDLLGNAVRFGVANDVLAAGEGIETMLSLRCVLPTLPMAAALSANHLAAMLLPPTLRRLYIARDADAAGDAAVTALTERAERRRHRGDCTGRPGSATSTRICAPSASTTFGQPCASSSRRRTSSASCCGRRPRRDERRPFDRPRSRSGEAHRCRTEPRPGLLEGDRTASGPARQWLRPAIFRRPCAGLCIAKQNSRRFAILRWRFGPPLRSGCRSVPPAVW